MGPMQKITTNKQSELALLESEARYTTLFETMLQGVVYQDASGKIISANPAAERIFGWTLDQIKGKTSFDPQWRAIHEDGTDFPPEQRPTMTAVRTGEPVHGVVMGVFNPIEEDFRWILVNSVPQFRPGESKPYQVFTSFEDITKLRTTEKALREKSQMLEAILMASPVVIDVLDREGKVTLWNPAAERLYGWSAEEAIGKELPFVSHQQGDELRKLIDAQLGGTAFTGVESRRRCKDGAMIDVSVSTAPLVDPQGQVTGSVAIITNVTHQKQASLALRESEGRYRRLFEDASLGIIQADPQGKAIAVNPALARMFGYQTPEEVLADSCKNVPTEIYVDPGRRSEILRQLKGDQSQGSFENEFRRKDGSTFWAKLHLRLIHDDNGLLEFTEGIIEDITERKKAEEQLKQQVEENLKRTQELEAIVEVSAAMRKANTRPEMMRLLLEQSINMLHAQAGAIGLLDGSSLEFQAATGKIADWEGEVLPEGDNLFWDVLQQGSLKFLDPPADNTSSSILAPFGKQTPSIQAGIISSLKSGETTIGVLFIGYCTPIQFSNTHKRLTAAIADMAGNALHRMNIADALEKLVDDRTADLETIYKVTAAASRPVGLETALQSALDPILNSVNAQVGAILLVEDSDGRIRVLAEKGLPAPIKSQIESANRKNSLESWVLAHKQPLLIPDLAADARVEYKCRPKEPLPFAALPMRVGQRVVGILEIARVGDNQFDLEALTLLSFIANHLGLIIENARLLEKAEQNAVLEERTRLARELHDSVTQSLYSAVLFADGSRRLAEQGQFEKVPEYLLQLSQISQRALKEMRLMVFELRSPGLVADGLARAIQHRLDSVENRAGIAARLEIGRLPEIPARIEEALYRIALEALNNALKHSNAKNILVSLEGKEEYVCLCVTDDGGGFDLGTAAQNGGLGLTSMRERAGRLQGILQIFSYPGSGTEIVAEIPLSGIGQDRQAVRQV